MRKNTIITIICISLLLLIWLSPIGNVTTLTFIVDRDDHFLRYACEDFSKQELGININVLDKYPQEAIEYIANGGVVDAWFADSDLFIKKLEDRLGFELIDKIPIATSPIVFIGAKSHISEIADKINFESILNYKDVEELKDFNILYPSGLDHSDGLTFMALLLNEIKDNEGNLSKEDVLNDNNIAEIKKFIENSRSYESFTKYSDIEGYFEKFGDTKTIAITSEKTAIDISYMMEYEWEDEIQIIYPRPTAYDTKYLISVINNCSQKKYNALEKFKKFLSEDAKESNFTYYSSFRDWVSYEHYRCPIVPHYRELEYKSNYLSDTGFKKTIESSIEIETLILQEIQNILKKIYR